MNSYMGPFVNVDLATGKTLSVQRDFSDVSSALSDGRIVTLVDVYGAEHAVNPEHVVHFEQASRDFKSSR